MTKKLYFISDDPPLKTKGAGFSVLLYHIIQSLKGFDVTVITYRGAAFTLQEILDEKPNCNLVICDSLQNKNKKNKLQKICTLLFSYLKFSQEIIKIKEKNNIVTVTCVGASASPLFKFLLLRLFCKEASHCLYIVDDLEVINKNYNNKINYFIIQKLLPWCIKKSWKLIVISEGLKDIYWSRYKKNSVVLMPVFEKRDMLPVLSNNQKPFHFIFTGGLSFLYNTTLQIFAKAMEELIQENNIPLHLTIQTYSSKSMFDALNFNPAYVTYATVANRNELINTYTNADCFVIPYSFSEKDVAVVSSSFPQKIAEIIQYGRKLFVIAPEYSTVGSFFMQQKLNYSCTTNQLTDIKLKLQQISSFTENDMLDNSYLSVYQNFFSPSCAHLFFNKLISDEG